MRFMKWISSLFARLFAGQRVERFDPGDHWDRESWLHGPRK
jgi:hypothetical protein